MAVKRFEGLRQNTEALVAGVGLRNDMEMETSI